VVDDLKMLGGIEWISESHASHGEDTSVRSCALESGTNGSALLVIQSCRFKDIRFASRVWMTHLQYFNLYALLLTKRYRTVDIGPRSVWQFFLPPPGISGTRSEALRWFKEHWNITEPALIEIAVGKS
jgi:hypothetical protein